MWERAEALLVRREDQELLNALVRGRNTPQKVALRARIVLGAAAGAANNRLAQELGISRPTVRLWRARYLQAGVSGLLKDAPRPGRRKRIRAPKVEAIVKATLYTRPPNATHWSVRTMARAQRVSPAAVQRIWQAHGLQPHRSEPSQAEPGPGLCAQVAGCGRVVSEPARQGSGAVCR